MIVNDVVEKSSEKMLADRFGLRSSTQRRRERWTVFPLVVVFMGICSELRLYRSLLLEIGPGINHFHKHILRSFSGGICDNILF